MAIPGAAPQPQHQPMQEIYPSTAMSVQDNPEDGTRLLVIQVPLPRKNIIIPMTTDQAEDIGGKLMAPAVKRPPPNGRGDIILPPGQLRG